MTSLPQPPSSFSTLSLPIPRQTPIPRRTTNATMPLLFRRVRNNRREWSHNLSHWISSSLVLMIPTSIKWRAWDKPSPVPSGDHSCRSNNASSHYDNMNISRCKNIMCWYFWGIILVLSRSMFIWTAPQAIESCLVLSSSSPWNLGVRVVKCHPMVANAWPLNRTMFIWKAPQAKQCRSWKQGLVGFNLGSIKSGLVLLTNHTMYA